MKNKTPYTAIRRMRLGLVTLGLAAAWAAPLAWADEAQPQSLPLQAGTPVAVRIGHVGPVTGPIAHLGRDNENGARLAVEDLNKRGVVIGVQKVKLELWATDDAGNPGVGVRAAQSLVDQGVAGVVGHLNSGTSIPASAVYNKAGIPNISPSATNPRLTRNGYKTTFRIIMNDEDLGKSLGKYAVAQLAAKRVVVVDDRTAYGQGIADYFAASVKAEGTTVLTREFVTDKTTDFSQVVESIKPLAPDLVFYGGMDATAGRFIKELGEQGLGLTLVGGDGICSSELPKVAGATAMERVKVVCAEAGGVQSNLRSGMDTFNQRYKARFNVDVMVYAPYTYDAVQVMVHAMEKAGSYDPKVYLPLLAQMTDFPGITGQISFDEKGDIKQGAYTLYRYVNQKRDQVEVRLGE
jgi:branched-chain amino acid transport system substrate-binding protein